MRGVSSKSSRGVYRRRQRWVIFPEGRISKFAESKPTSVPHECSNNGRLSNFHQSLCLVLERQFELDGCHKRCFGRCLQARAVGAIPSPLLAAIASRSFPQQSR